jgi:hypothetical protein
MLLVAATLVVLLALSRASGRAATR